jgi:hypothetical protein
MTYVIKYILIDSQGGIIEQRVIINSSGNIGWAIDKFVEFVILIWFDTGDFDVTFFERVGVEGI